MTRHKQAIAIISIVALIIVVVVMGLSTVISPQTALAQNQNITQLLAQKDVQVLYESPKSLILSGEGTNRYLSLSANRTISHMGEAIDIAKANGFTIDSVTSFTEESAPIGNTRYLTPVYTVFMSK